MHQTFYIDIDEEITSIVDRLRRSKAEEVVIVVPKRALLIQSIVNLKLLKKESESMGKQIMIVTQDKLGKILIEKAGILVQNKLDEGLSEEMLAFEDEEREKEERKKDKAKKVKVVGKKSEDIGSHEYFSEDSTKREEVIKEGKEEKDFENITNRELVTDISKEIRSKKGFFGGRKKSSMDMTKSVNSKNDEYLFPEDKKEEDDSDPVIPQKKARKNTEIENGSSEKLERFFSGSSSREEVAYEEKDKVFEKRRKEGRKNEEYHKINLTGNLKKKLLVFGILGAVIIGMLFAYLFLPKATIALFAKNDQGTIDVEIEGRTGASQVDLSSEVVPAKEVSVQGEATGSFSSTGSRSISNQKAKGKLTIYNGYSSSPQELVATTRFESSEGKIYRLVSGVTVPGMEGSEPGKVEGEVVADEAGEEYNISPGRFTIPGFKSSGAEKYSKFYAESSEAMSGGGKGSEEVGTISDADIANAKEELLEKAKNDAKEKIRSGSGEDAIILEEATAFEGGEFRSSNSVGEVAENFSMTVRIGAKIMIIGKSDILEILKDKISKKGVSGKLDDDSIELEFGKTDVDFSQGTMVLRIHSSYGSSKDIDLENLKKGVLGKNEDELKAYLRSYPSIEKATVEYWPPFISQKIPLYESRVEITLDNLE